MSSKKKMMKKQKTLMDLINDIGNDIKTPEDAVKAKTNNDVK